MFNRKGHLAEVLIVKEGTEVTVMRVTVFETEIEAADYEARMVSLVTAELDAQGKPYEHHKEDVYRG